ncbi:MAG: aspartate-semialdehyde dehydrogenase [Bacteroidota bacterium]
MKIVVVGATGLVGSVMLKVLEEENLLIHEIILVASQKSVGKKIQIGSREIAVISVEDAVLLNPEIAIFSAGSSLSKEWAPKFAKNGTFVIDNSSAWRMFDEVPLVVPEINADAITEQTKIIANPNCSTIQLVLALAPLHHKYGIKRLVISTYQSVTGTGVKAVAQLENERQNISGGMAYLYPIDLNVIPHGGDFLDDGYTTEEEKLVNETRKILSDNSIQITATVVRVPVYGGHSESINIEFFKEFDLNEVKSLLASTPGIVVQDNPKTNEYPMPLFSKNKNEVFVGRIRRDFSQPNSLNIWVVADNLRKGAATNAVQIAQYLIASKLV